MSTSTSSSVTLKFGYANTDFTRDYKFENVSASAVELVKTRVLAINNVVQNNPQSGEAQMLIQNFVADNFNGGQTDGKFSGIVKTTVVTTRETKIPLF